MCSVVGITNFLMTKFHPSCQWVSAWGTIEFKKRVSQSCAERGTKARLSFSGGPHAPVNMAESMEEVSVER